MRDVCIGRELDTAVGQVHELGRYVALPQAGEALLAQNLLEGAQRSLVHRALDMANAEGVRQGVDLKLQADLDDVEGRDHEAAHVSAMSMVMRSKDEEYRETKPATAPAITTCCWEPCEIY